MKSIVEYINEGIRLDEAKKVKQDDLLKGLDKIDKWANENNIKKLIASYMPAGVAEEFPKEHWKACVEAVTWVSDILRTFIEQSEDLEDPMDLAGLSDWVADTIYNESYDNELNKIDEEGDWDMDDIINLFNTVSAKVCKEAWLI